MNEDISALGYFNAMSPNLPLRQKIALAMLAKGRKAPQNLGEGIASVGQSFADAIIGRSLEDQDRAAMQAAATATVPPIADSAVPPTPSPQASVIPDNRPDIVPPRPPQARVIAPPVPGTPGTPLPPDQQQTYEPNAITRMPGRPTRGAAVVSDIPPGQPGNTGQDTFLPPGPLLPPVMAQGGAPADVPPAEEARRAIAHAELRRQIGGAPPPAPAGAPPAPAEPPRPSVGDYGQPSVLAASPQAIPAAPPAAPIRAAPSQGPPQPEAVPGFVPPQPGTPQGAPTIRPGPQEQQLQALALANGGNPYWPQSRPGQLLQALVTERERKQKEADKLFEAQVARDTKQTEQHTAGRMDQAKRIVEVAKEQEAVIEAKNKNQLRAQFGNMDPDTVFKTFTENTKVASSAAKSLAASQQAISALNAGAITGAGAEARLDIAKFFHNMGLPDKGNIIANTETFRGAMQPVVASIMHQTSGTSQLSEGELRFAAKAAAGDITLDANSIRQLTTIIDKASRGIIADHQKKVDAIFGDNPKAKAMFGVEEPKPPAPSAGTPDGTTATGPNGAKMIRRNGRWEPM